MRWFGGGESSAPSWFCRMVHTRNPGPKNLLDRSPVDDWSRFPLTWLDCAEFYPFFRLQATGFPDVFRRNFPLQPKASASMNPGAKL
jgi:hypothetical protein